MSGSVSPRLSFPERTLVIVGDLPEPDQPRLVAQWAARHGWPVVAEPFGEQPLGASVVPHGALILASTWFDAHRPDRIVAAGRVTLSRSVRSALTADPESVTYLRAGPRWIGPSYPVGDEIPFDVVLDRQGGAQDAQDDTRNSAWLAAWRAAGDRVAGGLADELTWGSGPALAVAVAEALPQGATLMVGSSNSVRDLELAVDWATARSGIQVVANRGLAGIDGVVSSAVGLALAGAAPAYALVGDLTFLHDTGALWIGPEEPRPDLTIIVGNDDGGGIFSTLEPGEPERSGDFERIFGTATGARIEDLAHAYGHVFVRAESAAALSDVVRRPPSRITIVEVAIDRSGHRGLRTRLREVAERALA